MHRLNLIIKFTHYFKVMWLYQFSFNFFFSWLLSEILYLLYVLIFISPNLNKTSRKNAKSSNYLFKNPNDSFLGIYNLCDWLKNYDLDRFFSGCFLQADLSEVYSENYNSFIAWAVYCSEFKDLTEEEKIEVINLREEASKRLKTTIKEGYNPKATHAKITLEPTRFIHQPLCIYLFIILLEIYTRITLRRMGFKRLNLSGVMYWIRDRKYRNRGRNLEVEKNINKLSKPSDENFKQPPILILHGICTGWAYYQKLIEALGGDRTVILVDYEIIKIGILPSFYYVNPLEFNHIIQNILNIHGIPKVVSLEIYNIFCFLYYYCYCYITLQISLIGHSWGTCNASWILRMSPEIVSQVVLIDPACLTLVLPDSLYCLLYKPPTSIADYLLCYFVRYGINLSYTLHNNFDWYNSAFSLEDLSNHIGIVVGVAEKDFLINSKVVVEMVEKLKNTRESMRKVKNNQDDSASISKNHIGPIKFIEWLNVTHGESILSNDKMDQIVAMIKSNESEMN